VAARDSADEVHLHLTPTSALLERTVAELRPGASAEEVVERVVAVWLPTELRDDVALLVVGLDSPVIADARHSRTAEHRSA
jgi:hypothetical protein